MAETENVQQAAQQTNPAKMLSAMGGVGIIAAFLIVFTFQITFPHIEENERNYLEKSIFEVVPNAETKQVFTVDNDGKIIPVDNPEEVSFKLYACYDKNSELKGIALEARDQGFQDVIRIIYGYDPQQQAIVGMKVLQSTETPGLGDKIEKDPQFLANFEKLDVSLNETKNNLLHAIELVKPGQKEHDYQISAITGATISSRAIANMLQKSAAINVPLIVNQLEKFKETK